MPHFAMSGQTATPTGRWSSAAPINPQRITEAFADAREGRGHPEGRSHDLRHCTRRTCLPATELAGIQPTPVHVVAARLGHCSPVVTLNVYGHVLPTSDGHAANVMAAVLAARVLAFRCRSGANRMVERRA